MRRRRSSRQSRPSPPGADPEGIEEQIQAYVRATVLAREAGYDGVEIMGSEGYLINEFLVTHTNKRTDDWGGSYANRMRFPVEVACRCREAVGHDFILIFRLSMIDLIPDGSTWDEVVTLAKAIEAAGATIINTGIGWHEAHPDDRDQCPARRLRLGDEEDDGRGQHSADHHQPHQHPGNGRTDPRGWLCGHGVDGAPFLADPAFVKKAAQGRSDEINICIGCNQARLDHTFSMKTSSCLVNPRACNETELNYLPTEVKKRVAVVGAGAAGMQAALVLDQRGHAVTLFDAADKIGGQPNMAAAIPGKEEFHGMLAYFARVLDLSGVEIRLNTRATVEDLSGYDEVILATGVTARSGDRGAGSPQGAVLHRRARRRGGGRGPRGGDRRWWDWLRCLGISGAGPPLTDCRCGRVARGMGGHRP